ncbi:hypothetical protein D1Z30_11710 [Enterococcus faecalis]|nr:hypothetical protein [Enterococcus faecalis]
MGEVRQVLNDLGKEQRWRFRGDFSRNGLKSKNYVDGCYNKRYTPTILLINIQVLIGNDWKEVADHLWLNLTKKILEFGWLVDSDVVEFDARVSSYETKKGKNYKLERPSKISVYRSGKILMKDDSLITLTSLEIETAISEQNKEYYDARDSLHNLFKIEHYRALSERWSKICMVVIIDSTRFESIGDFKECYIRSNEVIELHKRILAGTCKVKQIFYCKDEILEQNEIEIQIGNWLKAKNEERLRRNYAEYEEYKRGIQHGKK